MPPSPGPVVLAEYTRSGFTEGVHVGHAVVVDPSGAVVRAWGDPDRVIFPRSSNKPIQASAMVAAGLDLPDRLLALVASSHSAEDFHLAGVREVLVMGGLDETALQTPPDLPIDPIERDRWIAEGRGPSAIGMNCSGKHAGMLLTCVINDWDTAGYRHPDHPLQRAIRGRLELTAGESVAHVGVDGCGAPVLAVSLVGLARSLSHCVQSAAGDPGGRVVRAMAAHPEWAGGTRRDVTRLMHSVPGLVAKDGAEGVYVAALPDGTSVAVKVEDGADRARRVVLAEILVMSGVDGESLAWLRSSPVMGGGAAVGEVRSAVSP